MAKDSNYNNLVCDKNNKHQAYVKDGAPGESEWHEIKRIRADGTTISRWLCASCYAAYRALVEKQDADFTTFMEAK